MEKPLHTKTLTLTCDVEIIVPPNFETLSLDEKVEIVKHNLENELIASYEISYVPDNLEMQIED